MSLLLQVYASTSRDSLLAAVRDVLQTEVSGYALLGHEEFFLLFKGLD